MHAQQALRSSCEQPGIKCNMPNAETSVLGRMQSGARGRAGPRSGSGFCHALLLQVSPGRFSASRTEQLTLLQPRRVRCTEAATAAHQAGPRSPRQASRSAPDRRNTLLILLHRAQTQQSPAPHTPKACTPAEGHGNRPSRDCQAAAPVRRALAGAGTRPCALRARRLSGTPQSSSARCCSRSTAAAAGPPPTRRKDCGTCAGTARLPVRAPVLSALCRAIPTSCRTGAPRAPAAHGPQRRRLQAQVLQAGLRQGLCCNVRRDGGLEVRNAVRSGSVVRWGPQLVKRRSACRLTAINGLCRRAKRCLEACSIAGRRQAQAEQLQGILRGCSTSNSSTLPRPPQHPTPACAG
jgi:hypothetical protein